MDLSKASGVGTATIARFELGQDISDEKLADLERALVKAGAEFQHKAGRVGVTVPE